MKRLLANAAPGAGPTGLQRDQSVLQGPSELEAMSHTLLSGRQHFAHRCAFVIQDRDDAVQACREVGSPERRPNCFMGQVARTFTPQKALAQYGEELVERAARGGLERPRYQETLYALADLYCQGYELPWGRLFGDPPPRRIGLPTYPFARERYWVPKSGP